MTLLRCLLALCLACSSALVVPSAPLARAVAPAARSSCPQMNHRKGHVVRIEIEVEQGGRLLTLSTESA